MYSFKDHLKESCDCWKGHKRVPGTKPCAPGSCVKESLELDESLDPSEIASNPKMYDASIAKKAYYHKNASASDKESLARHLDRHHGNKEWRKPVKEDTVTEGERGLWDNIHAKRKRIKAGSGERMRKPGSKGAPTDADFKAANEEAEITEASKQKLMIGSKVTHPEHGKGTVVMHALGGGTTGTIVKFAAGKKVKVDHKKLTVKEELSADDMFDIIEELVTDLAEEHSIDPEVVWEKLESIDDDTLFEAAVDAKGHKSSTGGLTQKGREYYNRQSGGNLKAPVTTPPSKLKPGSKAANRRKSFCARMSGVDGPMKKPNGEPTRKALALRKWNC